MVFGNVGGMAAFLGLVLKFLVERFGHLKLQAKLINKLYKQNKLSNYDKNKEGFESYLKGEIEISAPRYLEFRYIFREILCGCQCMRDKNSDWAKYYNKVNVGYDHLLTNLDVVNYVRRIKQ
jgi:hypothetical protein